MVKRGTALPKKLKFDAIVEALLELRFQTKGIPEVFLGRLIDNEPWKNWEQRQLPAYNLPPQFRALDPNIQFAPIIELVGPGTKTILRVGGRVISYHRQAPYVGWEQFKPELELLTTTLFKTSDALVVRRLGLRYMNALRPTLHSVSSIADLDVKMSVFEDAITSAVNLNFTTQVGNGTSCTVRIATPEFVQQGGIIPSDTSVFVDVDVYTNEGFKTTHKKDVDEWVEFAHTQEKVEFFHLFRQPTIDKLREE